METFSALLALCAGNSPVTGEFPSQRSVTRMFDVFFDFRLNKRSSKQSRHRWFETPTHSLWRHCNDTTVHPYNMGCHICITLNAPEIRNTCNYNRHHDFFWDDLLLLFHSIATCPSFVKIPCDSLPSHQGLLAGKIHRVHRQAVTYLNSIHGSNMAL